MGDRGGGREAKGSSLKKSKSNPGCAVGKSKKVAVVQTSSSELGPSLPLPVIAVNGPYIDCASAMLSRQYDRDRDRVLGRAKEEGCCAVIEWFSDIEKQEAVANLAQEAPGFLYYVTGIHPNNVDRTNKKSHDAWVSKTLELGHRAECLGLLSGLNCSRETGTHFAQEFLLIATYQMAIDKLQLPIILHLGTDGTSLDRALEVLSSTPASEDSQEADFRPNRILIHDAISACAGDIGRLQHAVSLGCFFMVSAAGLSSNDGESTEAVLNQHTRELLREIPIGQLLVGSDSPWHTPQTLADTYLRTLRNEPSNVHAIVTALAEARHPEISRNELETALKLNTLRFFGLQHASEGSQESHPLVTIKEVSPTEELAELSIAPIVPKAEKELEPTATSSHFRCHRCSQKLFDQADVKKHGFDAMKGHSVFKPGEEGLCSAYVFISGETKWTTISNAKGGNAECSNCAAKLGRFCSAVTSCSCGAEVTGPIVKITADRVDFMDASADATTLAARALQEAEESAQDRALEEELFKESAKNSKGKKEKKNRGKLIKNIDSKGNYNVFRDKTFIRNASRSATSKLTRNENDAGDLERGDDGDEEVGAEEEDEEEAEEAEEAEEEEEAKVEEKIVKSA